MIMLSYVLKQYFKEEYFQVSGYLCWGVSVYFNKNTDVFFERYELYFEMVEFFEEVTYLK